jgi:MEMO1 family protein
MCNVEIKMNNVRPAAVAGLFYPDDASSLRREVEAYLAQAQPDSEVPKAIIAPHAGYIYSGPVAASAYASIKPIADKITNVVLLGPAHRISFSGLAAGDYDGFETPLGIIPVNQPAIKKLLEFQQVNTLNEAHEHEHSLEVHLPFLQVLLNKFLLIPLVVGDASQEEVAEVLESVWGSNETIIVISSDLSHYNDYAAAQKMDRTTSATIERLQPEQLHYDMACGRNPVNGLLQLAREKNMKAKTLDLRNSGDTAGPKDRVVGYGAYAFH